MVVEVANVCRFYRDIYAAKKVSIPCRAKQLVYLSSVRRIFVSEMIHGPLEKRVGGLIKK